jgi:hypothetical protein
MAEEPEGEQAPAQSTDKLAKLHDRALRRFDSVAIPQQELRAQSLEARRFVTIPGAMWEGAWGEQFENAPRPEVDKITKSLEKIETDYRENRLTVDFVPANDMADEDTAETLDGMHRADSYHFKAQQGRDNAFQEAIRGGFGAYRLTTEYADPDDPDDEAQRVNPGLVIVDADQSVYFDGASKLYDKSDANWAFVIVADPRAEAEDKWGAANISPWPLRNWSYGFDWYAPDIVRTAEYYEAEKVPDVRITLVNKLTDEKQAFWQSEIEASEVKDLVDQGWEKTERKSQRPRVHKYILNGTKVLRDCGYIAGDMIPIVPVYGRRDWVDNMERWRGHVGKKMDRQRIYNASIAKVTETQSLAPYEVPIVYAQQMAGYVTGPDGTQITIAEHWARGNIDRSPFRVILPMFDEDGKIIPMGALGKIEPPQVQPATAALLQISSADLTDDDQNADEVKANTSADAMDIAASRVDAKSGIYLDNMRQSIQREAEVYLAMAREVYFEEGRKVDTLTMDGQDGTATLAEPMIDTNKVYKIRNDLSRGKYKVVADVQESTTTKRQKTVRQNMEIATIAKDLQGTQDLAAAALLNAVMNQDGEGMQSMQKFARNKLIELGVEQPTPEEQAQITAASQQQQQPSPADQALAAQAEKLAADAKLSGAKTVDALAAAHLKGAQAEALGGPASAPDTPTGLHAVDIVERAASANLKNAQADHLRDDMSIRRIRTGHDITMDHRQQDHAESASKAA